MRGRLRGLLLVEGATQAPVIEWRLTVSKGKVPGVGSERNGILDVQH